MWRGQASFSAARGPARCKRLGHSNQLRHQPGHRHHPARLPEQPALGEGACHGRRRSRLHHHSTEGGPPSIPMRLSRDARPLATRAGSRPPRPVIGTAIGTQTDQWRQRRPRPSLHGRGQRTTSSRPGAPIEETGRPRGCLMRERLACMSRSRSSTGLATARTTHLQSERRTVMS